MQWHYNNREVGDGAHGAPCDMNVGAIAMPTLIGQLAKFGHGIKKQNKERARLLSSTSTSLPFIDDIHPSPASANLKSDDRTGQKRWMPCVVTGDCDNVTLWMIPGPNTLVRGVAVFNGIAPIPPVYILLFSGFTSAAISIAAC